MKTSYFWIIAVLYLALPGTSHASIVMSITETGGNVIGTATGSVNLGGLVFFGPTSVASFIKPDTAAVLLGAASLANTDIYTTISGPSAFGPSSTNTPGTSGGGNSVGFNGSTGLLFVPQSYVSGTALSSNTTWTGASLVSLGLTAGVYNYSWGTGPTADSLQLTISIAPAGVPEPGSLMLSGIALVAGLGVRRFRLRKIATAEAH